MAKKEERHDASCECHKEDERCRCDENEKKECHCHEKHDCGCHGDEKNEKCTCKEGECDCEKENHEEHVCHCGHHDHSAKAAEYLAMAQRMQADFENFRRRALEEIKQSKIAGQASVIEVFLPCLDTFKEAKKSISDEAVLAGVEMIENKIVEALKSLGVQKIASVGEKFNSHYHEAIAVMKDESKENDIILDEYQAGYTFNDKVIRYSKVIVNQR